MPAIFAEKQYTILLHSFGGPNHVRQSELYRDKTKEFAGWSGLELLHKDSHSDLYWGKYRSIADAAEDLKTARTWRAPNVNRPAFPFPKVVLRPGEEMETPQYNLLNVSGGHWTVLVAIYIDDPKQGVHGFVGRDRQRHALEYCHFLRKKGFEAYYHHTSGRTQITVGVFPEDAVVAQARRTTRHDEFVATQVIRNKEMKEIMATRDPPLLFLVVNDHTEVRKRRSTKTGKIVNAITPSRPMLIPGRKFEVPGRRRDGQ